MSEFGIDAIESDRTIFDHIRLTDETSVGRFQLVTVVSLRGEKEISCVRSCATNVPELR